MKGVFTGAMTLQSNDADEGSFDLTLIARALNGGDPAVLDGAFGVGGTVTTPFFDQYHDRANAVAIQSDGKIVAVGTSSYSNQSFYFEDFAIARYLPDGTLDATFSGDGKYQRGPLEETMPWQRMSRCNLTGS